MTAQGTISNLNQALRCAGKCDCEKLQSQINNLTNKINQLESKFVTKNEFQQFKQYVEQAFNAIKIYLQYLDNQLRNLIENKYQELNGLFNRVNQGIDKAQGWTGWQQQQQNNNAYIQRQIDNLKAQLEGVKKQIEGINRRIDLMGYKLDAVRKDVDILQQDVKKIWADLVAKAKEIAAIKIDLELLKKLIQSTIAGLPALIQSIILRIMASAAFNALINGIIAAFQSKQAQDVAREARDAWNLALRALGLAREAKADARSAANIAVKAEGKADKALAEIEFVKATALAAMKRLENLIRSEIDFLTKSTRDALLRLQGRIGILENLVNGLKAQFEALKILVGAIQSQFGNLQSFVIERLQGLSNAIEALKTNLLKQLGSLKLDIGKIFGELAKLAVQIAGLALTIAGIQALLGRLRPGGNVINNNTYVNNNFVTNRVENRYFQNTNITNTSSPADLALLKKIDNTTTTNLGVSTATYGLNQVMNVKLGDQIFGKGGKAIGIGGKLIQGFNWLIVDRAMNMLTLAVTIHNAAMLSQNIVATLTQAMQNIVELIGIKDDSDNPIELSTLINNSITNFVKAVVGKENYENVVKQWNYYNRIYQASANLFSSLLSMGDTMVNALNFISGQNAKIANALKIWRVVGDKAYGWMNITPNFNNPFLTKLNSLDETASMVEQVTQEPLNVKSAKEGLEAASKELADSMAQEPNSKQGKEIPEAKVVKEDEDGKKVESKGIAKLLEDAFEDDD
jgi:hypothetical protein